MKMEINYSDDDCARHQAVNLFSFCSKAECLNLDDSLLSQPQVATWGTGFGTSIFGLIFQPKGGHLVVTQNKTNKKALKKGFCCSDTGSWCCSWELIPLMKLVYLWICISCAFMCVYVHALVICSHTCVSHRLHAAAPLSCCHGELLWPTASAHYVCLSMCATSCSALKKQTCLYASTCVFTCKCMLIYQDIM